MSARRIGVPAAILVLAALVAAPAAASAAAIAFSSACYDYVPGSVGLMTIAGADFTPGDTVDLESSEVFQTAVVGPTGAFVVQAPVPVLGFIDPGEKAFTLTATSETTGTALASAGFLVANFAVSTRPAHARPTKKVHFTFSGFAPGRPVYGHFLLHGKLRVTRRYGRATGPCGTLKARAPLYPGRHPRFGVYRVQFDGSRRYSKRSTPRLVTVLDVFRTFHL
jgi:hypothetical protein